MNENRLNHWASMLASFNPRFYRSIAGQSFGRSLSYILLFSFLVSFALSVKYTIALNDYSLSFRQKVLPKLAASLPKELTEIKVENGQVSSPAPQPFIYKLEGAVFILDTTGQTRTLDDYKQGILVTKNKIIVKSRESDYQAKTQEFDLAKVESFIIRQGDNAKGVLAGIVHKGKPFDITYQAVDSWIKIALRVLFFFILAALFTYYFSAKLAQALIFSLFALLANSMNKANLSYRQLLNISFYALTPATIIAALATISGVRMPLLGLVYCLLYANYLYFGIKYAKENIDNPAEITHA